MYRTAIAMPALSRIWPLLFLITFVSGCATVAPWDVWISTASKDPTEGALNVGGSRPPVLTSCRPVLNSYANPCVYAFSDSNGQKVNVFQDLVKDLDTHAEKLDQLKQWVTNVGTEEYRQGQKYPYKMFLLTISPAVVLVVPSKDGRLVGGDCYTLFLQGCVQSQIFRGNAYWFRGAPLISENTYWFSPNESSGAVHTLDASSVSTEIKVDQALLRLTKNGNEWRVERLR